MKKSTHFLLFFFIFIATLVTVLIHDIFIADMNEFVKERKKMLEEYIVGEWWADFGRDSNIQIIFYPDSTFSYTNNSSRPLFTKNRKYNGTWYLEIDTRFNDVYIAFFAQGYDRNNYFKWVAYENQNSFWNIEGTWCIRDVYKDFGDLYFRKTCDSIMRGK